MESCPASLMSNRVHLVQRSTARPGPPPSFVDRVPAAAGDPGAGRACLHDLRAVNSACLILTSAYPDPSGDGILSAHGHGPSLYPPSMSSVRPSRLSHSLVRSSGARLYVSIQRPLWDPARCSMLCVCVCVSPQNLNPGQDTREQTTKRTRERRHEGTHERRRTPHTSTDQPTNQPHTQPTNPPRQSLTRSAPELVGRQDPRLRELH